MDRPIGYYVHHHGAGHRDRAMAVASASNGRIVLIGTGLQGHTADIACLDLPDDRPSGASSFDGCDGAIERPLSLHYAPLRHHAIAARMALVTDWIASQRPALMVVDVSVEIAMLARLCSTPAAYVRLNGKRDDPAHLDAFRGAQALIAPFHADLDDPDIAPWIRDKTIYCPGIVAMPTAERAVEAGRILVVSGQGGVLCEAGHVAAAARSMPETRWRVIGKDLNIHEVPENLESVGWSNEPLSEIAQAEVVIGGAGDGLVSAVIAMARPFVCIPEQRPYDEQVIKARRLKANGAAIVLDHWPDPSDWPAILEDARALDLNNLKRLGDPHGAGQTFRALEALAKP